MRIEGRVVVRADVAEDGSVQQVVAVSGPPLLVDAAVGAVRQWRYQPYSLNGTPVRRQTEINVDFKLP
jgi:protein TonB